MCIEPAVPLYPAALGGTAVPSGTQRRAVLGDCIEFREFTRIGPGAVI